MFAWFYFRDVGDQISTEDEGGQGCHEEVHFTS